MAATSAEMAPGDVERRFALFDYGFRPFFLFAGAYAVIALIAWLTALSTGSWPATGPLPQQWHTHEMLFGFAAAAIGGFLLTAVPSWTGRAALAGRPLILLVAIWLAGRVAMGMAGLIPAAMTALLDLAFFPALAIALGPGLIAARKLRNLPFLGVLALLFIANLLFHLEWMEVTTASAATGGVLAINLIALLIVVIGGRIVPAFTRNALRLAGRAVTIRPAPWLDRATIATMVLIIAVDLALPESLLAGALALAAALLNAARLAGWQGHRTLRSPILWVLHLGYAWIVIGLALKALWLLTGAETGALWLHALTIGAFATMILAVSTRASLGHTGRALLAPRLVTLSYLFVTLAALARVFGPFVGLDYMLAISLAGVFWIGAFALFVVVYAPILTRARPDGRPG